MQVNSLGLGGTQISALEFAGRLADRGFDTLLVGPSDTRPPGPSLHDVASDRGVAVAEFARPRTTKDGARLFSDLADRHDADLFHVWGSWAARGAYWGPCRLGRRPLVLTVYEMATSADTYRWPQLVVGTGYQQDELAGRPGPVHLVRPPVDLARDVADPVRAGRFLAHHGLDPGRPRVVLISRLDESMKAPSVEQVIRSFLLLRDVVLDLVVVGSGDAEGRLRAVAADVNRQRGAPVVTLTGAAADPRPAYSAATIAIGMGSSAARALAFGKPLVVSGEHGHFRLFTPETSEELLRASLWSDRMDPDPVGDVAAILRDLAADPDERRRLGAFGRQVVEAHYGLEAMTDRLEAVYRAALSTYGARAWLGDLRVEAATVAARRLPHELSVPLRARVHDARPEVASAGIDR